MEIREGLTALQVAAGQGAPAVIAALVQRGAKVDQLSAAQRWTSFPPTISAR